MLAITKYAAFMLCTGLLLTACTPFFKKSTMSSEQTKQICMNLKQDIALNDNINRGPSMQGTSVAKDAQMYQQYLYYNCDAALAKPEEDD